MLTVIVLELCQVLWVLYGDIKHNVIKNDLGDQEERCTISTSLPDKS